MAAHGLQHQAALHPVAQLVQRFQADLHHPLQVGLSDGQDAAARQMLAQQHAEHGGRVRVLPGELGQLGPGMVGIGGQQQLYVPAGGA